MKPLCVYIAPQPSTHDAAIIRFQTSYIRKNAGIDHDLLVICKGDREWTGPGDVTRISDEGYDLGPFLQVCRAHADREVVMLLSTTAAFTRSDWLVPYMWAFKDEAVAAVSATGSWERNHSSHDFNPHLRTSNFAVRPGVINALNLPAPMSKLDCWLIEHGDEGITRQLIDLGHAVTVVGFDGHEYDIPDWETADTFRTPTQSNLLISDNQTDMYANASANDRAVLADLAWNLPRASQR